MDAVVLGFEHGFGFSTLLLRDAVGAQNGFAMERRRLRQLGDFNFSTLMRRVLRWRTKWLCDGETSAATGGRLGADLNCYLTLLLLFLKKSYIVIFKAT